MNLPTAHPVERAHALRQARFAGAMDGWTAEEQTQSARLLTRFTGG